MNTTQFLRRWLPLVALTVVAIAAWQTAKLSDVDAASAEAVDYEFRVATPLLSARRIPETVRAPVIDAALQPSIDAVLNGSSGVAACLVVFADDRLIREVGEDTPLVPASNQKLLTTYAALLELGPDARFVTTVRAQAQPQDGILDGDLYFIGAGDPFLSTEPWRSQYEETAGRFYTRLEDLADGIVAAGVTQITGSVLGDESLFDSIRQGPWAQRLIDQRQSGPLSGLTVNEGFQDWPEVYTSAINRTPGDDPPLQAARVLAGLLAERGVALGGVGVGVAPTGLQEIASVTSPALVEIITHINSYSNNYGAEILLKHLGRGSAGVGSTATGSAAVLAILSDPALGIDTAGAVISDGSGLAETDRVTCQLLEDLLDSAGPESAFARSLSVGGERGSLLNRHIDSPAEGHVFAKTGTLNGVTALSGYVESPLEPGTFVLFSYIANGELAGLDENLRAIQEPFVESLATYPSGPAIDELDPAAPVVSGAP